MGALIAEEVRCAAAIKAFVREIDAAMEKAIRWELQHARYCDNCGALHRCVTLASTFGVFDAEVKPKHALLVCDGARCCCVTARSVGEFEPNWANPVFW